MNLPASPLMPASPSPSTTSGHNNDAQVPATPYANATSGHNTDPVDELARVLSVLLLAPSSALIPLGVLKDCILPYLAADTYSICKLAVVHPYLHRVLSGPAYWAGKSIYVSHDGINHSYISSRGRRVPFAITPITTDRFASFVALPAFAHVQALDLNSPYMDQQLTDAIQENMSRLTSLSVGTRGFLKGVRENYRLSHYDRPLFWSLLRSLPELRELVYPCTYLSFVNAPSFPLEVGLRLHTLHLINLNCFTSGNLGKRLTGAHLPALRVLTLVKFSSFSYGPLHRILQVCPHLRLLSFRNHSKQKMRLETLQAWAQRMENHPDFDGRTPGWSSKICFDLRETSTDLCCFVPAEAEGEKEQEGGEGVVMVSPSRSLAPMYGDWLDEAIEPGWEVHGNEVRPTEKKRGGKRKAREEGQREGGGGGGGGAAAAV